MNNTAWPGILEILEVQHIRNNEVIWKSQNLKNLLHLQGEEYILKIIFSDIISKPEYFYFGMDNRTSLSATQTLEDLDGEPTRYNYIRQAINSTTDWSIALISGVWEAKSAVVTFTAAGGDWPMVRNLFLTTQDEDAVPADGYLISTVSLGSGVVVHDGESLSLRMGCKLRDCSS